MEIATLIYRHVDGASQITAFYGDNNTRVTNEVEKAFVNKSKEIDPNISKEDIEDGLENGFQYFSGGQVDSTGEWSESLEIHWPNTVPVN